MNASFRNLCENLRNNPIIVYNAPWRRGWWRLSVLMLLLSATPIMAYLVMAYAETDRFFAQNDAFLTHWTVRTLGLLITVFATPIIFWIMCRLPKSAEEVQDLYLTRMTPQSIVWGSFFWGIVVSFVVCLIPWITAVLVQILSPKLITFITDEADPWLPSYGGPWEGHAGFLRDIAWLQVLLVQIIVWIATVAICVYTYLNASGYLIIRQLRSLFRSIFIIGIVLMILRGGFSFVTDHTWGWRSRTSYFSSDSDYIGYLVPISTPLDFQGFHPLFFDTAEASTTDFLSVLLLIPIHAILIASLIALTIKVCLISQITGRFFRSLNEEYLIRSDWKYRERLFRVFTKRYGYTKRSVLPIAFPKMVEVFLFTLVSTLVSFNLVIRILDSDESFNLLRYTPHILCAIPMLSIILIFGYNAIKKQDFIVESARIKPYLRWYVLSCHAAILLAFLSLYFNEFSSPRVMANFIFAVIASTCLAELSFLLLIPKKGREFTTKILASVFIITLFTLFLMTRGVIAFTMPVAISYIVASLAIIGRLFHLPDYLIQRIHDSEVADHAPGQLSTEEPAGAEKAIQMLLGADVYTERKTAHDASVSS